MITLESKSPTFPPSTESAIHADTSAKAQAARRHEAAAIIRREVSAMLDGDPAGNAHLIWWDQGRVKHGGRFADLMGGDGDVEFGNRLVEQFFVENPIPAAPTPDVFAAYGLTLLLANHGTRLDSRHE